MGEMISKMDYYDGRPFHRDFLGTSPEDNTERDPMGDLENLKVYLKRCFELSYRHVMLIKERGEDDRLEYHITMSFQRLWDILCRHEDGVDFTWS